MLRELVAQLDGNTEYVIIVDNASDPPVRSSDFNVGAGVYVLRVPTQPPNLYQLWNIAFEFAKYLAVDSGLTQWNVSVFNDDTLLPPDWTITVRDALRNSSAAIACGSLTHHVTSPLLKTERDGDILTRMTPHAFMMRGELNLRADERFRWWWGDTDLDWQARLNGGVLIIPGCTAINRCANSTTVGKLAEQAGRDGEYFSAKWGQRAW
jgi:glycosyltransferase involved in cell wall biosynthesis